VQRAAVLWAELEREAGQTLFVRTGGLMIGAEDGELVRGARASAEQHGLPYEWMRAREVAERFPALRPSLDMVALLEGRAGVLFVETCVRALSQSALAAGAELRTTEPMLSWRAESGVVRVVTAIGEHVADRLVLALGPWLPEHLNGAILPLAVERQTQHWLTSDTAAFSPARMPITIWETTEPELPRLFYTIPDFGDGVKMAVHHEGEITSPDRVQRTVSEEDALRVRRLADRFVPDAGALRESMVCLYTNTPDGHFLLDRHPVHNEVMIASACSGHGFKFAPAIGELVAGEVLGTSHDLELFRLARFV
jgi:sarcosine oxidase